jgi:hypothetical protein
MKIWYRLAGIDEFTGPRLRRYAYADFIVRLLITIVALVAWGLA